MAKAMTSIPERARDTERRPAVQSSAAVDGNAALRRPNPFSPSFVAFKNYCHARDALVYYRRNTSNPAKVRNYFNADV